MLVASLFAGSDLVTFFELEADALLRGTSGMLICIAFSPWVLRVLDMGPARD